MHSQPFPDPDVHGMVASFGEGWLSFGDSLVTLVLRRLVFGSTPAIALHPMAVAGWFGMFVTMLNLLPIAQLDGGHILYAAAPRWHRRVARTFWFGIMLLGWLWPGWLFWGFVVLVLSRGQLGHPPVLDTYRPLPRSRGWLVWASIVLFVLTFAPAPIR
jgi:membrane-associated protease RseP (regulator of RpoE activity)